MTRNANKPPLIVILGPTASGKSSLAIKLAKKFNGFIISADSRQIYRYLDIGAAKIANLTELAALQKQRAKLLKTAKSPLDYILYFNNIAHYMMDIIPPQNKFSVAEYKDWVYKIINNKTQNSKLKTQKYISKFKNKKQNKNVPCSMFHVLSSKFQVPFLVGGTGLYIDAVADNLQFAKTDPILRQKLENQAQKNGIEKLYQQLIKLDPQAKKLISAQNPRRIIRALEICLISKKPFSQIRQKRPPRYNILKIGLNPAREELYQKIDSRAEVWFKMGLLDEVQTLIKTKKVSLKRIREFGLAYKIIANWFNPQIHYGVKLNKSSAEYLKIVQKIKWNLHAYARRQLTWFRRDKTIHWIKDYESAEKLIEIFKNQLLNC